MFILKFLRSAVMSPGTAGSQLPAHCRKTYSRKYLTDRNPTGIVSRNGKKKREETESKGHSERGKERGRDWRRAANAFCRNWLLNVPVIGVI